MSRDKGEPGDARSRLIEGMRRGFRVGGFAGIGVDALAKEAGLTSGAFYAQFGSKADAFAIVVSDGLAFLRSGIEIAQRDHGAKWLGHFVDFYLARIALGLDEACALPTFSPDVARASTATRTAYTKELHAIVDRIAEGFTGRGAHARAWRLLAILSGAAGMARAVADDATRTTILDSVRSAAKAV